MVLLTGHGHVLHLVGPRAQSCTSVSRLRPRTGSRCRIHWSPRKSPRDILAALFLGAAHDSVSLWFCNLKPYSAGQKSRRTGQCLACAMGNRTHDCDLSSTRSRISARCPVVCESGYCSRRVRRGWLWVSLVRGWRSTQDLAREIRNASCSSCGMVRALDITPNPDPDAQHHDRHCAAGPAVHGNAMKQSHDPAQLITPLDVARQAAWIGGGSGMLSSCLQSSWLHSFFSKFNFCSCRKHILS
jgi:hypothetical protein